MENDNACNIVGIGSITLKFRDGTATLLRNVRHVPFLKRNLISFGMLDSIGCEYKGSTERFEIYIKRLQDYSCRFKNQWTISHQRSVQEPYCSNVFDDMLTERDLWHRRLFHISGNGLKMLSE